MKTKEKYEAAKKALEIATAEFEKAKAEYELEVGPAWFAELVESCADNRKESLQIAMRLGADEKTCRQLAGAERLRRVGGHIKIETRYGGLSRGKPWARDSSDSMWAEKEGGAVLLTPGKWKVGSSDGFSRKESPSVWVVEEIKVGEETWLIAN